MHAFRGHPSGLGREGPRGRESASDPRRNRGRQRERRKHSHRPDLTHGIDASEPSRTDWTMPRSVSRNAARELSSMETATARARGISWVAPR